MSEKLQQATALVSMIEAELVRIHADMQQAEALAAKIGMEVPWKPAAARKGKRKVARHASHKDAREVLEGLLERDPIFRKPFTPEVLTARVNLRMTEQKRSPYTVEAVAQWLRTFQGEGFVVRLEKDGLWDKANA